MAVALKAKTGEVDVRAVGLPAIISDQIRELITRGVLAPGVHLGQAELADRFSVSRVPVREALKLLAAEGAVMHDPNRGFFVAQVSSAEARQLYRLRHLLEGELLSTLDWPTPAQLKQLKAQEKELEKLLKAGEWRQWAERHRAFHRAIFDLSPQKVLVGEAERLWALTDRYRSLLPPPRPDELGEPLLVSALAKQDRNELLRVFHADRNRVEQLLLRILHDRNL